jgi:hypothetical protein
MTNAALITRLSEAKEGSRELSDEVLLALGYKLVRENDGLQLNKDGRIFSIRLDPTCNLQDTVNLVPSKWGWSIEDTGVGLIYLKKKIPGEHGHLILGEIDGGRRSPPIGMCIAILKAMETEG